MSKPSRGKIYKGVVSIEGMTNLKPGDEVVVVKPLQSPVFSSRTGRILGMDEKVIGRGKVVEAEDSLVVKLEQIKTLSTNLDKRPVVKKGITRFRLKAGSSQEVIVKLLNERMK